MLKSAEEVIPATDVVTTACKMERRLAVYMREVFQADVDMESDVTAGQFLHSRMANTKYRSTRGEKSGAKPQNWEQIDNDTLPLVKEAIRQLQGDGTTRPKRVTVFAVERMLHLSSKKISLYLPQCLAEIQQHEESQQQYWAREVVWAANQLRADGSPLVWRRIRELTNMRPENYSACLRYVLNYQQCNTLHYNRQSKMTYEGTDALEAVQQKRWKRRSDGKSNRRWQRIGYLKYFAALAKRPMS